MEDKKYECGKCGAVFDDLNVFRGHNLKCKPVAKEETTVMEEKPKSEERRKRVPVGVPRLKLKYAAREGYRRRWVNDVENRINDFADGGYEFVEDSKQPIGDPDVANETGHNLGSKVSKIVGRNEDGTPKRAYLMQIKEEWYQEDQSEKQKYIDDLEFQIKHGIDSQGAPGVGGRYIPKTGGTVIERK